MPFEYVSAKDAMAGSGLRMVVLGGIPSPWGEAAKGIFHMKGIQWSAVRNAYDDPELEAWAGGRTCPIAVYDDEKPRTGWWEILQLAERLAPNPRLLPTDFQQETEVLGLGHLLLSEGGLLWNLRLALVDAGLKGEGGFDDFIANYLASKYGYRAGEAAGFRPRVAAILKHLAERLETQSKAGSDYLVGSEVTAADIYLASSLHFFSPLPEERCAMDPGIRKVWEGDLEGVHDAIAPSLYAHRDMMYERHLEPVLSL